MHYHRALTIAGSDSSGGAGIQADLKTFSALDCYGMSVITALTAQNTMGVDAIHKVPPEFVTQQLEAVLTDVGADAIKIGMLDNAAVITAIARVLKSLPDVMIVLDPVMIAKGGCALLEDAAIDALKKELFPLATLITPNIPEAEKLLNINIKTQEEMEAAARALSEKTDSSVLLKGGHFDGDLSPDCFCDQQDLHWFVHERIDTKNTHGTGCTLSSAITAFLAKGDGLFSAIKKGNAYLQEALLAGSDYKLGQGHGPVKHF